MAVNQMARGRAEGDQIRRLKLQIGPLSERDDVVDIYVPGTPAGLTGWLTGYMGISHRPPLRGPGGTKRTAPIVCGKNRLLELFAYGCKQGHTMLMATPFSKIRKNPEVGYYICT